MSHFTVLVRVPAKVPYAEIPQAVRSLLIPYKEAGCGEKDPPELEPYLTFEDTEDEERKDYETKLADVFVDPQGKLHSKYSEQFRHNPPGSYGVGSDTQWVCPPGWIAREASFEELYGSFEVYMKEYVGYSARDEKARRYGRWRNENQKWDWYQIGGRWTGFFKVRHQGVESGIGEPGLMTKPVLDIEKSDYNRIEDIDFDAAAAESQKKLEDFWVDWQKFTDGHEFGHFDGPRKRAFTLGLVTYKDADELTGKEWRTLKWPRQNRPGVDRFDVLTEITREELISKYAPAFNQLKTYAFLDAAGWHAPGEMGWFGYSSDSPDTYLDYARGFMTWLRSGDQRDWVVAVDCHI